LADSLKVGTTTVRRAGEGTARAASWPAAADFDWSAIAALGGSFAGAQLLPIRATPALYLFVSKERSPRLAPNGRPKFTPAADHSAFRCCCGVAFESRDPSTPCQPLGATVAPRLEASGLGVTADLQVRPELPPRLWAASTGSNLAASAWFTLRPASVSAAAGQARPGSNLDPGIVLRGRPQKAHDLDRRFCYSIESHVA
jgi:hypothetical protein